MAWSIFRQGGGDQAAVGWARTLLTYLNAPVTPGNVEFIYQWEKSEGGGGLYNPLNVGPLSGHKDLLVPGDTGSHFGGGAADYASWQAGLLGAMYGIQLPYYKNVLSNLRANNPAAARSALWASPWAASHYGYGSNWYFGSVPNGTPILPPLSGSPPPTGGGTSGSGGDTSTPNAQLDTCAWKITFPTVDLAITSIGGGEWCIFSKPQVRAMAAAGLMLVSVGLGVVGAVMLVAFGFRPMAGKAAQIAQYIPAGGAAVRAAGRSGATKPAPAPITASKSPAAKPAAPERIGRHRAPDDADTYGRHAAK